MKLLPSDSSSDLDKARRAAGRLNRLGPVGGARPAEAGRVTSAVYVKLSQTARPSDGAPTLLDAPPLPEAPQAPKPRVADPQVKPPAVPRPPEPATPAPRPAPAPPAILAPPPEPMPMPAPAVATRAPIESVAAAPRPSYPTAPAPSPEPPLPVAAPEPPPEPVPVRSARAASFAPLPTPVFEPEPPDLMEAEVEDAETFDPASVLESLEPSAFEAPREPELEFEPELPDVPSAEAEPTSPAPASDTFVESDEPTIEEEEEEVDLEPEEGPEVPAPVFELEPMAPAPPPKVDPEAPPPLVQAPPVMVPPPVLPQEIHPFSEDVTEISFETSFDDDSLEELPAAAAPPSAMDAEALFEVEDLGAEEAADVAVIDVSEVAEEPAGPASWDPYLEDGLFLTRSRSALLIDGDGRVVASKGDLSANAVDTVAGRLFPAIQQTPLSAPFISLRLGRFFATAVRLAQRNLVVGFVSENPIREELVPLIQKEFGEAR